MSQVYPNEGLGRLCRLFGRTRQAFYKRQALQEQRRLEFGIVLDLVFEIRKQLPRIGGRKLYFMLKDDLNRHGIKLGRDKFFGLLSDNNLLVKPTKRYRKTTNSHHWLRKYPNLTKELKVLFVNTLWVSDITYIHVSDQWAYVIFITDVYSHKVVGYNVEDSMSAIFCVKALEQALTQWTGRSKTLIHHSDRGLQYCSNDYTSKLKGAGIRISMTEQSDPRENAIAERVNGIFKGEFLMDQNFESLEQAQTEIATMVDRYNDMRPHLSCDYLTPNQAHQKSGPLKKHWKDKKYPAKDADIVV